MQNPVRGTTEEIVDMKQSQYLEFCRLYLQIPEKTIQLALTYANFSEDVKFDMIQDSYKKDKIKFVSQMPIDLHDFVTNIQPDQQFPDRLPPKHAYKIIDSQKSSEESWQRFAHEILEVDFDKASIDLSHKILSRELKYRLLYEWGRSVAGEEQIERELAKRYLQYQLRKTF